MLPQGKTPDKWRLAGMVDCAKNNEIITPPISSSALKGITRDSVIKISKYLEYKASIKKITTSQLLSADEVFLSGTAAEITPIIKINHKKIGNGKSGKITKMLMTTYTKIVMNKNKKYSHWLTKVY